MARSVLLKEYVEIPEGIEVHVEDRKVKVKGPLGEVSKDFSHVHNLMIKRENEKIHLEIWFPNKKGEAVIGTVASRIRNMITGVQRGFRYKMKIVYAHFPMSVKVDEKRGLVIIENFLGSKDKRYAKIMPGVKVKVTKDDVIVEGIDIDAVGQTATNIHLATHLKGKRKMSPHGREGGPGILDGIYLYAKEHIK